jgi:Papain-like cysteine protease AvrRpt2
MPVHCPHERRPRTSRGVVLISYRRQCPQLGPRSTGRVVAGLLLGILACGAPALAEELDVSFRRQHTLVWCWAATIAMVGAYVTGRGAEDCEVLSAYDQLLGGPGSCCQSPQRCARTGSSREMKTILSRIFGLSGYHYPRPLTYAELKREIDRDKPFIAAIRNGFSGHVVVVSGYETPDHVILLDPMSGRHVVRYGQLRQNFQLGSWSETLTVSGAVPARRASPPPPQRTPYCCDASGNRRCSIQMNPGPPGSACACTGQGSGITCY